MTVAIMPSNAANSRCHSKLKFCKHFPVVSVVQFFMVVLHHQPGDSLLTADSKVQERTAGSGVFPSEQKSGGHSGRPERTEPQATNGQARGRLRKKGPSSQFPKSQGWDTGLFKVQADNQKRGR